MQSVAQMGQLGVAACVRLQLQNMKYETMAVDGTTQTFTARSNKRPQRSSHTIRLPNSALTNSHEGETAMQIDNS